MIGSGTLTHRITNAASPVSIRWAALATEDDMALMTNVSFSLEIFRLGDLPV